VHDRGERIVNRSGHHPEQKSGDQRGRDELPSGHAGGARDHKLKPPRQRQIARHRAHQHGKRHDAFGELGHAKQRNFRKDEGRGLGPIRAATQELDIIDHAGERDHAEEGADDGAQEPKAEVTRKRARYHRLAL